MYVLTNSHRNLGAAAILYPGVQKKIAGFSTAVGHVDRAVYMR